MANPINPNDPYRLDPTSEGLQTPGDPARLDTDLQADPELAEGPANGSRVAVFALGIAVVLGAVFYGLNSGSNAPDATKTATQSAPVDGAKTRPPAPTNNIADSQSSKPAVPPGVRDVTPGSSQNTQPGMTTGAAPARPQAPQSAPTGTEVDRAKGGTNN
jgi:hypothetical protein